MEVLNTNTMEKKYVIKDFESQGYYCGIVYGFCNDYYLADYFDTIEDAERVIEKLNGSFQIELVYVV
jgi:hypothetical protein